MNLFLAFSLSLPPFFWSLADSVLEDLFKIVLLSTTFCVDFSLQEKSDFFLWGIFLVRKTLNPKNRPTLTRPAERRKKLLNTSRRTERYFGPTIPCLARRSLSLRLLPPVILLGVAI